MGHLFSRTSPHTAQNLPPTGSCSSLAGLKYLFPSTSYTWCEGQFGFGQNPLTRLSPRRRVKQSAFAVVTLSDCSGSCIENFRHRFSTASRLSFVPSPCSNIESADCLHPMSRATTLWERPACLRASLAFLHISGSRFVTSYIMHHLRLFYKPIFINSYQQPYQLINTCL